MHAAVLLIATAALPPLPNHAYREIVEAYRAGDRGAVERLGALSEAWIHGETARLRAVAGQRERCRREPARAECAAVRALDEFPFAAAAVLHTERAFLESASGGRERLLAHLELARGWIDAGGPPLGEVLRRWLHVTGRHALRRGDLDAAEPPLEEGIKAFPADAPLWLAAGILAETRAHLVPEPDSVAAGNPRFAVERMSLEAQRRDALAAAEKRLRTALACDPSLLEARVRLGRVLLARGRLDDALSELHPTTEVASDPGLRYLACLLAGRIEERRGRWAEAVSWHRRATAARPSAEAGWVALAHALDRAGDSGAATVALARILEAEPEWNVAEDPFRAYSFGSLSGLEAAFEVLREQAR